MAGETESISTQNTNKVTNHVAYTIEKLKDSDNNSLGLNASYLNGQESSYFATTSNLSSLSSTVSTYIGTTAPETYAALSGSNIFGADNQFVGTVTLHIGANLPYGTGWLYWRNQDDTDNDYALYRNVFYDYTAGSNTKRITFPSKTGTLALTDDITEAVASKQDTLVSGTNIKTINSESILGSGNITTPSTSTEITNKSNLSGTTVTDVLNNVANLSVTTPLTMTSTSGAITLGFDSSAYVDEQTYADNQTEINNQFADLQNNKQDNLVSGTNIKTINGNSLVGSGSITIHSTLSYVGYLSVGSSTATSFTQYTGGTLSGGSYGRIYCIHAKTTGQGGGISVQRKTTYYTDYDCIAQETQYNSGYWLSITVVVPPNTTYYLFYMLVNTCYWTYFSMQ